MYTLALERVEVNGQRCDERLTFTRFHLGDTPLVQNDSAYYLNSEMLHAEASDRRLAAYSKRLRQQIVESLAVCEPLLEF